jgi:hypothetical protein
MVTPNVVTKAVSGIPKAVSVTCKGFFKKMDKVTNACVNNKTKIILVLVAVVLIIGIIIAIIIAVVLGDSNSSNSELDTGNPPVESPTQSPVTQPPVTQPPVTQPPVTQPPAESPQNSNAKTFDNITSAQLGDIEIEKEGNLNISFDFKLDTKLDSSSYYTIFGFDKINSTAFPGLGVVIRPGLYPELWISNNNNEENNMNSVEIVALNANVVILPDILYTFDIHIFYERNSAVFSVKKGEQVYTKVGGSGFRYDIIPMNEYVDYISFGEFKQGVDTIKSLPSFTITDFTIETTSDDVYSNFSTSMSEKMVIQENLYCTLWGVGVDKSLYKSIDGGINWTQRSILGKTIRDVCQDRTDYNTLWGIDGGNVREIIKSTDGGRVWTSYGIVEQGVDIINMDNDNYLWIGNTTSGSLKRGTIDDTDVSVKFSGVTIRSSPGKTDIKEINISPDGKHYIISTGYPKEENTGYSITSSNRFKEFQSIGPITSIAGGKDGIVYELRTVSVPDLDNNGVPVDPPATHSENRLYVSDNYGVTFSKYTNTISWSRNTPYFIQSIIPRISQSLIKQIICNSEGDLFGINEAGGVIKAVGQNMWFQEISNKYFSDRTRDLVLKRIKSGILDIVTDAPDSVGIPGKIPTHILDSLRGSGSYKLWNNKVQRWCEEDERWKILRCDTSNGDIKGTTLIKADGNWKYDENASGNNILIRGSERDGWAEYITTDNNRMHLESGDFSRVRGRFTLESNDNRTYRIKAAGGSMAGSYCGAQEGGNYVECEFSSSADRGSFRID